MPRGIGQQTSSTLRKYGSSRHSAAPQFISTKLGAYPFVYTGYKKVYGRQCVCTRGAGDKTASLLAPESETARVFS
jgi:hypothetical protein